jgi:hypothetical protein
VSLHKPFHSMEYGKHRVSLFRYDVICALDRCIRPGYRTKVDGKWVSDCLLNEGEDLEVWIQEVKLLIDSDRITYRLKTIDS